MLNWKKIKRYLFGPRTELEFVEAALKRYKSELQYIEETFDPKYDCCPLCVNRNYYKLIDKIERVEKQLERLRNRKRK